MQTPTSNSLDTLSTVSQEQPEDVGEIVSVDYEEMLEFLCRPLSFKTSTATKQNGGFDPLLGDLEQSIDEPVPGIPSAPLSNDALEAWDMTAEGLRAAFSEQGRPSSSGFAVFNGVQYPGQDHDTGSVVTEDDEFLPRTPCDFNEPILWGIDHETFDDARFGVQGSPKANLLTPTITKSAHVQPGMIAGGNPYDFMRAFLQRDISNEAIDQGLEISGYHAHSFAETVASGKPLGHHGSQTLLPYARGVPRHLTVCKYARGFGNGCQRADCHFSHVLHEHICKHWLKGGTGCLAGETCPYSHDPHKAYQGTISRLSNLAYNHQKGASLSASRPSMQAAFVDQQSPAGQGWPRKANHSRAGPFALHRAEATTHHGLFLHPPPTTAYSMAPSLPRVAVVPAGAAR
ncbi:hypothetical protein KEM55_004951, partial [Ascosphaera atra]